MWLAAYSSPVPPMFALLGTGYLAAGAMTAAMLARRGEPVATAALALVTWPLLLPALWDTPRVASTGPLAQRIESVLAALAATLADPASGDVGTGTEDLQYLRDALHRADTRVALVDRLLGAPDAGTAPDALGKLRDARARAVGEIEGVLAAVVELRLQVGLLALHGDAGSIRERLRELRGRIGALDEVSRATHGALASSP